MRITTYFLTLSLPPIFAFIPFSSRCSFAVGIFRPGKPHVSLAPVSTCYSIHEIRKSEFTQPGDDTVTQSDFNTVRSQLTERFGSVKRRRELRSQELSKFNVDDDSSSSASAQAALDTAASVVQKEESQRGASANQDDMLRPLLPKFDRTATDPADIYNFADILPKALWSSVDPKDVEDYAKESMQIHAAVMANAATGSKDSGEESKTTSPQNSTYVHMRLARLATLKGKEREIEARMLILIHFLTGLYRTRHVERLGQNISCSPDVAEYILENFTSHQQGNSAITDEHRAKALTYIAILALKTSTKCEVEEAALASLASQLRITVSSLVQYFREVGCTVAGKTRCRLTAPLKLPDLGGQGGKRKR